MQTADRLTKPNSSRERIETKLIRAFFGTRASGVVLVFALLLLWEMSVRLGLVTSENWPAFSSVLEALWSGIFGGELLHVTVSSLWRMAAGYALGVSLGVVLGLAMARSRLVRLTLEPSVELLRPLPAIAIIPPLIFLLGVDDAFKIAIVTFATFFPVVVNTMSGVFAVDAVYLQVASTFGVSPRVTLVRVIFPASLPYVLAGMRISLSIALIVTVVAEMLAGSEGIGYHVLAMQHAMRAADMYAAIIVLALVGYALNRVFLEIEAQAIHWARLGESLEGRK